MKVRIKKQSFYKALNISLAIFAFLTIFETIQFFTPYLPSAAKFSPLFLSPFVSLLILIVYLLVKKFDFSFGFRLTIFSITFFTLLLMTIALIIFSGGYLFYSQQMQPNKEYHLEDGSCIKFSNSQVMTFYDCDDEGIIYSSFSTCGDHYWLRRALIGYDVIEADFQSSKNLYCPCYTLYSILFKGKKIHDLPMYFNVSCD